MIVKSVLKYPGPRKEFLPWTDATVDPSQAGNSPRLPTSNPVSQPACKKRACGLGVPSGRTCGGWQGCGGFIKAAPLPHCRFALNGPTGTAYKDPYKFLC